jgi:alpha-amylase/alpha-mannosidase (GH57 family)
MERYICIHGHFYQPPRENPWLESIELQDSAYPYHDWNERITAECYAPNSVARIVDGDNRIVKLINNYGRISFNFGPTLLSWLEVKAPEAYAAILDADRDSQQRFSGHGSALAQVYNHVIMPLANSRDRKTQIRWGIGDFLKRFRRPPEGMWLAETAVDTETLELLADQDIRFVILAPHQAARVRPIGERQWHVINGETIDPSRAYRQVLPSGRAIALFFYDGPIARAVAFEGVLSQGERFVDRLLGGFSEDRDWPQLVHIATDGESYGHHHRFGDMALAYALDQIETKQLARLTNYGEFLEKHPPSFEVEIAEKTSWSCAHGIDRWWSDCGCNSGAHPGWNQQWRTPLRNALDGLRDAVTPLWQQRAAEYFKNIWFARDCYIEVILDRSAQSTEQFFHRHAARPLTDAEKTEALKLLEMQRHLLLMYTSCGWFFDDISGIETVQVMQFAGRAVQLAEELFGDSHEQRFIERLESARSNLPDHGGGKEIYDRFVRSARVDWERVGAHYAVSSLFDAIPGHAKIYCYRAERKELQTLVAGKAKLVVGEVMLSSEITGESATLSFGALHLGDHNVNGGVRPSFGSGIESYLARELAEPFMRADFAEVLRLMDRRFGESNYSLRSLFHDEQRKLLEQILQSALAETESLYRQIYEHRAPLLRFLKSVNMPQPNALRGPAELIVNSDLRRQLEQDEVATESVKQLLAAASAESITLDTATLEFTYRKTLERIAESLARHPTLAELDHLNRAAEALALLPFTINLWKVQNYFYQTVQHSIDADKKMQAPGNCEKPAWIRSLQEAGHRLGVRVI